MAEVRLERRLAAILAADVAGYSRLMGTDEVATLRALKAHRVEPCSPAVPTLVLLDAGDEVLETALLYLGRDVNSESAEDLAAAAALIRGVQPNIRYFHGTSWVDDLANGEICIAVGYSGDILQARDRAAEAGKPADIRFSIPKEGALMWFDTLAIPADAKHPGNAHLFIDYLLRPEVAAANSNYVNYATANTAALPLVNEELRNDAGIFPTPQVQERLQPNLAKSAEFTRSLNRAWTRFVTGR